MLDIQTQFPPNIDLIRTVLPASKEHVFCYGNTVYNPSGKELSGDIIFHESVHAKQQEAMGIDSWWYSYLTDPAFRLSQEVEAYGEQYKFLCTHVKDRNFQASQKHSMALALASEAYGDLISYGEAESKIRNFSKS